MDQDKECQNINIVRQVRLTILQECVTKNPLYHCQHYQTEFWQKEAEYYAKCK